MKFQVFALFLAVFPQLVWGQSLNVDFDVNDQGAPTSGYGAAAGQQGYWTRPFWDAPLKGLDGQSSGVTFSANASAQFLTIPGATPDELSLMGDAYTGGSSNYARFHHLFPGSYRIYIYQWFGGPDGGPGTAPITVNESTTGFEVIVSTSWKQTWPGGQVLGETYTAVEFDVIAPDGVLYLGFNRGLNGVQIVQVPAPAAGTILMGIAVAGLRRRR